MRTQLAAFADATMSLSPRFGDEGATDGVTLQKMCNSWLGGEEGAEERPA